MKPYIKLGVDGRVTIPSEIRQRLRLKAGARLKINTVDGCIFLRPVATKKFIDGLRGCLKGGPSLSELREREHRDDRE